MLRVSIYLYETPPAQRLPYDTFRISKLAAGDELEENALTSWDSLGKLVEKYSLQNPPEPVPTDIIDIRDALAHGRIMSVDDKSPLRLVRFSQPCGGRVKVESAQTLSPEWIEAQVQRIYRVVLTVHARMQLLKNATP